MNTFDDRSAVVLVIDDEKSICESFRNFLEDHAFNVLVAEDGIVGLEIFKRERPDLVLLDLRMPEMDGLEVLPELRQYASDTPVIVVSGTGRIDDVIQALRLGACDYLLKPVEDLAVLRHAVDKALERARLIRENRYYQDRLEEKILQRTEQLQKANLRIRESEKKYRTLFEESRDAIFITGEKGNLVDVNPFMHHLFGYKKEEMIGLDTRNLFATPDGESRFQKALVERGEVKECEVRLRRKDGSLMDCIITVTLRRAPGGGVLGSQGIIRDVTARKRLEGQIRQAQKMEAIGTLASGIAHDFNNILIPVILHSEMIMMDHPNSASQRSHIEQVLKAAYRARDLVRQILTFSRRSEQEKEPLELAPVVKECIRFLRASLPATIEIRREIETESATVLGDPVQIHQLLMNLITNAAHAMREKGGVLEVSLCDTDAETVADHPKLKPGPQVRLTVRDTGCGMTGSVLEQIFDPFFTTKDRGEGTGMGLAVVHGIVEDCNGAISIESEPEKGTTFHIFLPRVADHAAHKGTAPQNLSRGSERILFVDDNEVAAETIEQMLGFLGYSVIVRWDGAGALEVFREDPYGFDLVITDQTMPKMPGMLLAQEILKIRPGIPIILCTGFNEESMVGEATAIGIRELMFKPVGMKAMAAAIRRVLDEPRTA